MTPNEALEYYLEVRTGDLRADVIAALQEAAKRRQEGPKATAVVIRIAHDELGLSYRDIEHHSIGSTGAPITQATAQRLAAGTARP
jgi:hypothetical protein